ncbi:thiamine-phosphate pyrophosphorylase [Inquilinus ginsengisoli]|uniref:Thiamine-phosphate pyrophosphorylase n=1 Tax=Inquilinus ginsengisoli TaxID=363840 RepID=A0ABU1K327_9PROT|nr:thiamine phosphate synthase [Inquilinus ginsengisoli]MDR6294210.1 thiamine-phosphate pyrophosphorylase [Inquilinus ginsengisoli]
MTRLPAPALLLITDRSQSARPLEGVVADALAVGCRWVSVREKDLPEAERRALLRRISALAQPVGAIVTVHADLEAAAEADGLHLAAGGDPGAARHRLGPSALIGASCHSGAEVAAAIAAGADYVTLGPVAPTASKPGYVPALSPPEAGAIARRHPGRVIALGGVEPDLAAGLLATGFAGIAVMGSVMRAPAPGAAIAALLAALQ